MPLRVWLATIDGWASQFGDDEGPLNDEELDALDAAITPEQKAWLGWTPDTIVRQKENAAKL